MRVDMPTAQAERAERAPLPALRTAASRPNQARHALVSVLIVDRSTDDGIQHGAIMATRILEAAMEELVIECNGRAGGGEDDGATLRAVHSCC